jgi:hypothetical protein
VIHNRDSLSEAVLPNATGGRERRLTPKAVATWLEVGARVVADLVCSLAGWPVVGRSAASPDTAGEATARSPEPRPAASPGGPTDEENGGGPSQQFLGSMLRSEFESRALVLTVALSLQSAPQTDVCPASAPGTTSRNGGARLQPRGHRAGALFSVVQRVSVQIVTFSKWLGIS